MGCQAGIWGAIFGGRKEGMGYPFAQPGEKGNNHFLSEPVVWLGFFVPRLGWGLALYIKYGILNRLDLQAAGDASFPTSARGTPPAPREPPATTVTGPPLPNTHRGSPNPPRLGHRLYPALPRRPGGSRLGKNLIHFAPYGTTPGLPNTHTHARTRREPRARARELTGKAARDRRERARSAAGGPGRGRRPRALIG